MQTTKKNLEDTKVELTLIADEAMLATTKENVLKQLRSRVKIQGFRQGKAPLPLVEKNLDPSVLQTEFLDKVVNQLYMGAIQSEQLKPVSSPEVVIQKFVPFTTLEIKVTVEVVGTVTLPDYKKVKLAKTPITITDKDVDEVIEALRTRAAEKVESKNAAKNEDEVTIDFAGNDAKTKDKISGAEGKDYPLVLGSDSFIPGFEKNIIGMKAGEEKTFTLTFPKDYGVAALQNRKVEFTVTVKKVNELKKPTIDDTLAAKVGPFKTLKDLREDIKTQLKNDRGQQADRDYESELLEKISKDAKVAIPTSLLDEEVERIENDEKQNIMYRGQTWQEHLDEEGVTAEQHKEQKRPAAESRVKAGLVLAEIAAKEGIDVTKDELDLRMQLLRGQYTDKRMQEELNKPETRRDIAGRMVTEKTIAALVAYATK